MAMATGDSPDAQLLGRIMQLDPVDFEEMVAGLFEMEGFVAQSTPRSGDGGVDLYLQRGNLTAIVQCKRLNSTVGEPTVRDLYGTMLHVGAQGAFLVTTGGISEPARRFAAGKPIKLFDGRYLLRWLHQHEGEIRSDPTARQPAPARPPTTAALPPASRARPPANLPPPLPRQSAGSPPRPQDAGYQRASSQQAALQTAAVFGLLLVIGVLIYLIVRS